VVVAQPQLQDSMVVQAEAVELFQFHLQVQVTSILIHLLKVTQAARLMAQLITTQRAEAVQVQ
jgi:hypothetical protein